MSVAKVYGNVLYELASEINEEDKVKDQFADLLKILTANSTFVNLLSNPRISKSERLQIFDNIFKVDGKSYLLSLVKILIEERKVGLLSEIFDGYVNRYNEEKNILPVRVISAVELRDDQVSKLTERMSKITGKNVIITNKVDESVIGGVRIEYDGHLIDASIQYRFKNLEHILKNADYSQLEV
jgi:F-type H+-transporting ATPase subunit delta